jgi:hypothetical protein
MLSAVTPALPDPLHPHIRGIFEQERLAEVLSKLGISALKLDSVLEGFSNTVCRRPELFEREPYTGSSRVIVKAFPPDIPPMRIWFTYDDDNVYIEHVEPMQD